MLFLLSASGFSTPHPHPPSPHFPRRKNNCEEEDDDDEEEEANLNDPEGGGGGGDAGANIHAGRKVSPLLSARATTQKWARG